MADQFPDDFGLGQHSVAKIRLQVEADHLRTCAAQIIDTTYSPTGWREMHVRLFHKARPDYDKAVRILEDIHHA